MVLHNKNIKHYMKNLKYIMTLILTAVLFTACQDKDLPGSAPMQVPAIEASQIQVKSVGVNNYDCEISWPAQPEGTEVNMAIYRDGSQQEGLTKMNGTSRTITNIETGVKYEFLIKCKKYVDAVDKFGNEYKEEVWSSGTLVSFTRNGAQKIKELELTQKEREDGITQDLIATWVPSEDAESYIVQVYVNDVLAKTENLSDSKASTYTYPDVKMQDVIKVSVISVNKNGMSLPVETSLLIGKTKFAFLSVYDTIEEHIANGDDDEVSSWLWFHETYPEGKFLPFSEINSAEQLSSYRMLFWMYDVETDNRDNDVLGLAKAETAKTAAPYIKSYVQDGGNLLLWQHAVVYVGYIGRLDLDMVKKASTAADGCSINCGKGGFNPDLWKMGVNIKNIADLTGHPIYKGLATETEDSGRKLLPCSAPGWKEDHNFCMGGIPATLTEMDPRSKECYDELTTQYGIYPLGFWDGQWEQVNQLNIWEAKAAPKAPAGFENSGIILCVGNGGMEFSQKSSNGEDDKSATPKHNSKQSVILQFAKNCVNYLRSN